jgi:hypothetical protein
MRSIIVALLLVLVPTAGCGGDSEHDHGDAGHPDGTPSLDGPAIDSDEDCSPSGVAEAEATRTSVAASVTVDATLLNALQHCAKGAVSFRVVLDTHSVDLLAIDLLAAARVTTDLGAELAGAFVWEPLDESSHHRDGILSVAAPPLEGAGWLRLTLFEIAGVDRTFEWDEALLTHDLP